MKKQRLKELKKQESDNTKVCTECETILSLECFSFSKKERKNRISKCRSCSQRKYFNEINKNQKVFEHRKRQMEAKNKETKNTKACTVCYHVLPLDNFSNAKNKRKGKCCQCKECVRKYKQEHKKEAKNYRFNTAYGITLEKFNTLFYSQQNKCKICGTRNFGLKGPALDHCHNTGKIRGVLCNKCNLALGLLNDDIEILRNAIQYLEGTNVN